MRLNAIVLLVALCTCAPLVHAQQATPLQQRMGAEAFNRAGLDKLQPTELAYLQQWLEAHAAELSAAVPASSAASANVVAHKMFARPGASDRETKRSDAMNRVVSSTIVGPFRGWQPGSILVLQNGQQWRVSDSSSLMPRKPINNPQVKIQRGAFGAWFLKVGGYNTSARVEPVN